MKWQTCLCFSKKLAIFFSLDNNLTIPLFPTHNSTDSAHILYSLAIFQHPWVLRTEVALLDKQL